MLYLGCTEFDVQLLLSSSSLDTVFGVAGSQAAPRVKPIIASFFSVQLARTLSRPAISCITMVICIGEHYGRVCVCVCIYLVRIRVPKRRCNDQCHSVKLIACLKKQVESSTRKDN